MSTYIHRFSDYLLYRNLGLVRDCLLLTFYDPFLPKNEIII